MERDTLLKDGTGTHYGLGLDVYHFGAHWMLEHDGEVTGFTAANMVLPDDRIAVAVLTNQMASGASSVIARQILSRLFENSTQEDEAATRMTRQIFDGLQKGRIDRALFTENANLFFTEAALSDYRSSLGPLGQPASFSVRSKSLRGGMVFRSYSVVFPQRSFNITTFQQPDRKLEQYLVIPSE